MICLGYELVLILLTMPESAIDLTMNICQTAFGLLWRIIQGHMKTTWKWLYQILHEEKIDCARLLKSPRYVSNVLTMLKTWLKIFGKHLRRFLFGWYSVIECSSELHIDSEHSMSSSASLFKCTMQYFYSLMKCTKYKVQ